MKRLELELSRRCGLQCIHCSVRAAPSIGTPELALEDWLRVVREFSAAGGTELVLTGGEPLLYEGLETILQVARECSLSTRVYTAAYLAPPVLARAAAADMVCVSIEGNSTTHDAITGIKGSYASAIRGIEFYQSRRVPVRVHFTPVKSNYRQVAQVAELAANLNCSSMKVLKFTPQGRGEENAAALALDDTQERELMALLETIPADLIEVRHGGQLSSSTACGVGEKLLVTSSGEALPCLGLRDQKSLGLGSVSSTPFSEIIARAKMLHHGCLCAAIYERE